MKKTLAFISGHFLFFILCFALTPAFAQGEPASGTPKQIITLKDGSVVKGQLVGVHPQSGDYIIQTETLGQVSVAADKVLSVNSANAVSSPNAGNVNQPNLDNIQSTPEFKTMKDNLLSDPAMFEKLQALAADPAMLEILQDQDFLKSLSSQDPAAIENNPKFQKLINHPAMQALIEGMKQKMPSGSLAPSQR